MESGLLSWLLLLPVVIRADLTAAADQVGWNDLTYAAAPEACGHDMDVPEIMLYGTTLVSPSSPVTVVAIDHAARMSTPGAVKSGCTTINI